MKIKRKKKRIIFSIILASLLALASITGAYALSIYSQFNHKDLNQSDEELGIGQDDGSKEITNIALFGVDTRGENFSGNSDSIMVVSVDKKHNKIKMISILRDSLVKVDGHGNTKITEAYGYGGSVLAVKTINQNYHLNIRDYATINFAGMAEIIDAVGGVTIDVSQAELSSLNGLAAQEADQLHKKRPQKITQAGAQTLNGLQAVGYSRIRKINNDNGSYGDYGRTDRQRTVMQQLFLKVKELSPVQYPSFLNGVLPYLETSLSANEILDLAGILSRDNVQMEDTRLPLEEYTINAGYSYNGKSTVYYNLQFASDLLHAFIYEDISPKTYLETHEIPTNGWLDGNSGQASGSTSSSSSKKATQAEPSKKTSSR